MNTKQKAHEKHIAQSHDATHNEGQAGHEHEHHVRHGDEAHAVGDAHQGGGKHGAAGHHGK